MSLQPKQSLSFEEWLEGERANLEGRSEFVDGEVFAMTGASSFTLTAYLAITII